MQIIPLSEGAFSVGKTKIFYPFNVGIDNLLQREPGSLLVEIQPFLIITSRDTLLIDAGLGYQTEEGLQIYQNLSRVGVDPAEITKVLMSHLHKDHSGGVSRLLAGGSSGRRQLSFPNASYYVQGMELRYAFEKGFPSYITQDLEALEHNDRVVLLQGDGLIDGYIHYEISGAHCPYHQVFFIEDEGEKIFFGGDVAPQLQQMRTRFIAKYDFDGKKCMELRKQWWERGEREAWTFLFYHDIKTPVWRFAEKGS
jgi:glyoxylase-like metal-dependent hydrolase (beta-lactamase superfamily II)